MLKFFSRLEKTRNFVILIFALLLVLSMVLFGASVLDFRETSDVTARSKEVAAKVGSDEVTVGDIVMQKENLSRFYTTQAPPAATLVDGLVRQKIVRQEAARLGLTASDREIADQIREANKPTDGKPFDINRYEQNVTEQYGSVRAYEENARDNISAQKVEAFVSAAVNVTEDEILDDFKKREAKFDLSYVPVSVPDLAQSVKPTDEELQAYFDKNKQSYFINSPQKKIRYVFVNTAKIGEKIALSDEELKAEYDKLPADKKQAGIQGQQIVLRVAKPEFEAQVLEKANQIIANAKKDGKVSEEAFAQIAQGQSEDPNTARTGGKIPGLIRANPNNPTDPYQRLLNMQEGDISEPVKYSDRYYILRRGASVPKTFEEAKKELEVSLRNRKAYTVAAELAQKIDDDLKQSKNVEATAQKFAAEANMSAKEMVRETDYVKPGDDVPNVGVSPQFEEGIAPLTNVNDVGEKIPVKDGFAMPLLVDKKDPRDATFAEVKDKVTEALKLEKARAEINKIAAEIAAGANNAAGLAAAAQAKGLKVQEAKNFILGSPLGQGPSAGTSEELQDAIFALKPGEVTKSPVQVGENFYIVAMNKREEANMEEFAKQRDQLLQSALSRKRGQIFDDYINELRRKMEADGSIKIYKDVLTKIDAADAPAEVPAG